MQPYYSETSGRRRILLTSLTHILLFLLLLLYLLFLVLLFLTRLLHKRFISNRTNILNSSTNPKMNISTPSQWTTITSPNNALTISLNHPQHAPTTRKRLLLLLFREIHGTSALINEPGLPLSDTSPLVQQHLGNPTVSRDKQRLILPLTAAVTALLNGNNSSFEGLYVFRLHKSFPSSFCSDANDGRTTYSTFLTGWMDNNSDVGYVIIEKLVPMGDHPGDNSPVHDGFSITDKDKNTDSKTTTNEPKGKGKNTDKKQPAIQETEWTFKSDWEDTTKTQNHTTTEPEWDNKSEWETTTEQNKTDSPTDKWTSEWDVKTEWDTEDKTKPSSPQPDEWNTVPVDTWDEQPNKSARAQRSTKKTTPKNNRGTKSSTVKRRKTQSESENIENEWGRTQPQSPNNEWSTSTRVEQAVSDIWSSGSGDDDSGSGGGSKHWAWTPSDSSQESDGKSSSGSYGSFPSKVFKTDGW